MSSGVGADWCGSSVVSSESVFEVDADLVSPCEAVDVDRIWVRTD